MQKQNRGHDPSLSHSQAKEFFLLAAKQSEILSLENLARSCQLVTLVSELIHELQKERGLSNVYLASDGKRFEVIRKEQITNSLAVEKKFRGYLETQYMVTETTPGCMRLYSYIVYVLQGLDNLTDLRKKIENHDIDALTSTEIMSRLIGCLLSVVFEAADSANDPALTKALVALFNFMQGKEYAGQERAYAAIGFASGNFNSIQFDMLDQLRRDQQNCFNVFTEFAETSYRKDWKVIEQSKGTKDLNQLLQVIDRMGETDSIASEISEVWYDLATQRIDQMKQLEIKLTSGLLTLSNKRVEKVNRDLVKHREFIKSVAVEMSSTSVPLSLGKESANGNEMSFVSQQSNLNQKFPGATQDRSLSNLIQKQTTYIKKINDELFDAKHELSERKLIDRAKGVLMENLGLSEEKAYQNMRKKAMETKSRLVDVAVSILKVSAR